MSVEIVGARYQTLAGNLNQIFFALGTGVVSKTVAWSRQCADRILNKLHSFSARVSQGERVYFMGSKYISYKILD